jgi:hypothetical protein
VFSAFASPLEPGKLVLHCQSKPTGTGGLMQLRRGGSSGHGSDLTGPHQSVSASCGGWRNGSCAVHSSSTTNPTDEGVLVCAFDQVNSTTGRTSTVYANGTAMNYCAEVHDWTGGAINAGHRWQKKQKKRETCAEFVDHTVCTSNPQLNYTGCQLPGGCANPDSCIRCATQ